VLRRPDDRVCIENPPIAEVEPIEIGNLRYSLNAISPRLAFVALTMARAGGRPARPSLSVNPARRTWGVLETRGAARLPARW